MKANHIYLIIIAVLFLASGTGMFSTVHFRKENQELEAENAVLAEASAMLLKENEKLTAQVSERDTFIKYTTLAYDTLKSNLTAISTEIAIDFPSSARIHAAAIDSQVVYIADFINASNPLIGEK